MVEGLFYRLFPDQDEEQLDGSIIHARHKYAKHLEFFEAGAKYRERCFMAANRVGKTLGAGGFETAAHLTGEYPFKWLFPGDLLQMRGGFSRPGRQVGGRQPALPDFR